MRYYYEIPVLGGGICIAVTVGIITGTLSIDGHFIHYSSNPNVTSVTNKRGRNRISRILHNNNNSKYSLGSVYVDSNGQEIMVFI